MIPNEIELSRDFGVSVGTMRKALQTLTDQGLLVRRQGRGTFVAEVRTLDPTPLDNLRSPRGEPMQWLTQSCDIMQASGTPDEVTALELGEGESVFRLQRVLRDTLTSSLMLERCALPQKRFAGLESDPDSQRLPLAQMSRRYGILVGPGSERVGPHLADSKEADLLEVKPGDVILKLVRIVRCFDGIPVELRTAFCNLRMDAVYSNRIR